VVETRVDADGPVRAPHPFMHVGGGGGVTRASSLPCITSTGIVSPGRPAATSSIARSISAPRRARRRRGGQGVGHVGGDHRRVAEILSSGSLTTPNPGRPGQQPAHGDGGAEIPRRPRRGRRGPGRAAPRDDEARRPRRSALHAVAEEDGGASPHSAVASRRTWWRSST